MPAASTRSPRSRANGPSGAATWNAALFPRRPNSGWVLCPTRRWAGDSSPAPSTRRHWAATTSAATSPLRRSGAGSQSGVVDAVQAIAAELTVSGQAATPAQVALAWLLAQGRKLGLPVVPIPGTRKAARIDENWGALALTLDFTTAQLEKLDAAADAVVGSRSADPNWVSEGREQRLS
ncbi:aldo/keto reductase [Arthrobacter sp. OVS8]|nr:aldo/keto reductase [Arthrobacter sp. OVS8]